jgi:hypothetical protein
MKREAEHGAVWWAGHIFYILWMGIFWIGAISVVLRMAWGTFCIVTGG